MFSRLPYLLFLWTFFVLVPLHQRPLVDDESSSSPSLENQDFAPLALQYRLELVKLIETGTVHQSTFDQVNDLESNHNFFTGVMILPEISLADPCYGLMSLQL